MRLFVSGSAPLLAETHARWREATGHAILERYGMTETNMITSNPYDGERIAGTVGFPLPGVSLRVAEPEGGAAVAEGEVGVIEVKGPNVFKGYWRMPEKTAAEFRPDGFFITGDLGGSTRAAMSTSSGAPRTSSSPAASTSIRRRSRARSTPCEGVIESAVIGLPHPDFGEGVAAVVVRVPGASIDEAAIREALEGRLAKFKQPKRVFFVEALPRNAMGKVQKATLREAYKSAYQG